MSILSLEFLIFLPCVVAVYYAAPICVRWIVLLVASLVFYAVTGWQGVICMVCIAGITFFNAKVVAKLSRKADDAGAGQSKEGLKSAALIMRSRKWWMAGALLICLGALVFFKYFEAARTGLNQLLAIAGGKSSLQGLGLIVPLGMSYFTFQSVGYLIDVYRGKFEPEKNPFKYLLFVSFFPQITQGPISPWPQLAPQIFSPHRFEPERFIMGGQLLLWGYFKKLVIADRIAPFTSVIVTGAGTQPGWLTLLGVIAFSIRLYADFSGGMDVIRGAACMLGIDMIENFRRPFFSVSVAEYWRRWHISLGAWFRAYVFYPLTISRAGLYIGRAGQKVLGKKAGRLLPGAMATVVIFLAIGLWHTANWNAVLFGLYFGLLLGLALLLEPLFKTMRRVLRIREKSALFIGLCYIRTWLLILIAQYFACSPGPHEAFALMINTVQRFGWPNSQQFASQMTAILAPLEWVILAAAVLLLLIVDIMNEHAFDLNKRLANAPVYVRWPFLLALILIVLVLGCYGQGNAMSSFLYTQF